MDDLAPSSSSPFGGGLPNTNDVPADDLAPAAPLAPVPEPASAPTTYLDRLSADRAAALRADFERVVRARFDAQLKAELARDFDGQAAFMRELAEEETRAAIARLEQAGEAADPAAAANPSEPFQSAVHLTDTGNARRFISRNGADVRYCPAWESWLCWRGGSTGRWVRDTTGEGTQRAIATALAINAEASAVPGNDEQAEATRKAIRKWAETSEGVRKIDGMLTLAATTPSIVTAPSDYDRNPLCVGVPNGMYSFLFGGLVPPDIDLRKFLLTKRATPVFDPTAEAPRWTRFISEIMNGDQELIEFLRRAIGYSLTGKVGEQVMFVLHGIGSNGKSTLLDVLTYVFGDYARPTSSDTFSTETKNSGAPNPALAALVGARFVPASEVNKGRQLNEGMVKAITGGDLISVRDLFGKQFTFAPTFKVWLACNHKPKIGGNDEGIWRRIRLIPFEAKFKILKSKSDALLNELKSEASGILRWAIEGGRTWVKEGLGTSKKVLAATAEYRDESDRLRPFFEEWTSHELADLPPGQYRPPGARPSVGATELFDRYARWADLRKERPITQTAFGLRLKELGFTLDPNSPRLRVYVGLRLLSIEEHAALSKPKAEYSANG